MANGKKKRGLLRNYETECRYCKFYESKKCTCSEWWIITGSCGTGQPCPCYVESHLPPFTDYLHGTQQLILESREVGD